MQDSKNNLSVKNDNDGTGIKRVLSGSKINEESFNFSSRTPLSGGFSPFDEMDVNEVNYFAKDIAVRMQLIVSVSCV